MVTRMSLSLGHHHILDAGDVFGSAHVSPPDQEVRGESHAADHVTLASLSLPLLRDDPLALQELDLALVPHGTVVSVELHVPSGRTRAREGSMSAATVMLVPGSRALATVTSIREER